MATEFPEYDGSCNRFDWILEEARKLRTIRQADITRGLLIKSMALEDDRMLWRAVDEKIDRKVGQGAGGGNPHVKPVPGSRRSLARAKKNETT
jgi:hypothetical protein